MKALRTRAVTLCLLSMGAACSVGIAAAVAPARHPPPLAQPLCALSPLEESIARQPFAPKEARALLAEALAVRQANRRIQSLLPDAMLSSQGAHQGMGWALPDRQYWDYIPQAARRIPRVWSRLPVVRFTNTELGGVREIRLWRGPEYDQWLLNDPLHALTACISIQRTTRRIYFMEITRGKEGRWDFKGSQDFCYSCHPSGPRVIRPLAEPRVDLSTLTRFNRLLLSYGACDFGDSVDTASRGEAETDARCLGCHNDKLRGKLYEVHTRPIVFKTRHEQTMPPLPSNHAIIKSNGR